MNIEDESTGKKRSYLMMVVKSSLIGLICGAVIVFALLAVIQLDDFSSNNYAGLGPVEVKHFGYTIMATKRREVALIYTLEAAWLGAIAGAILGFGVGLVKAFTHSKRIHL